MVNTYDQLEGVVKRLNEGAISAVELQHCIQDALASRAMIEGQIARAFTVDDLKRKFIRPGRKSDMVTSYYKDLVYHLIPGEMFVWSPFGETWEAAVLRISTTITDEKIAEHAEKVNAQNERAHERMAGVIKALNDPHMLKEYCIAFEHGKTEAMLMDDQLAEYDLLVALDAIEKREAEDSKRAEVKQISTDTALTVEKSYHDKRQCDIWLVKLTAHVERDQFNSLAEAAKRLGGRWSSWGPASKHGFVFFNEEDANNFAGVTENDVSAADRRERVEEMRQGRAVDRLMTGAEKRSEAANEAIEADRLTNTVKRARQAESALQDADALSRTAGAFAGVAAAIEDDDKRLLKRIRYGTQVELLERLCRQAKADWAGATSADYGECERRMRDADIPLECIRYAHFPWPTMSLRDAQMLLSRVHGCNGAPALRHIVEDGKHENGFVRFDGWKAVEALQNFEGMIGRYSTTLELIAECKRLSAMGVRSLPHLRAVLREFIGVRPVKPSIVSKVRLMELDLVGRKIPGYFPTPRETAEEVVSYAIDGKLVDNRTRVLEPSAGSGRLADAFFDATGVRPDCIEIDPLLVDILQAKGHYTWQYDFLKYNPILDTTSDELAQYDIIIMNPPFEDGQDCTHVKRAYDLLCSGGRIVAIISKSAKVMSESFQSWLDQVGAIHIRDLEAGTFRDSGTNVLSQIILIDKEERA